MLACRSLAADAKVELSFARKLQKEPIRVYLTFDDGPNEGTAGVLDALKKYGVRATFFVNSDNLEVKQEKKKLLRSSRDLDLCVSR